MMLLLLTMHPERATAPPAHLHASPPPLSRRVVQVGVDRWQGPPHADRKQAKALAAGAVLERLQLREREREQEQQQYERWLQPATSFGAVAGSCEYHMEQLIPEAKSSSSMGRNNKCTGM